MTGGLVALLILTFLVLIIIAKTAIVVPQQSAYVVERLGRFHAILNAGFHVLLPFVDAIRYRHSLKEMAVDIPAQVCITRDNVQDLQLQWVWPMNEGGTNQPSPLAKDGTIFLNNTGGIVQAIEDPLLPFLLGVQWHPELLLGRPRQQRLFDALVAAARG